ncbi:uncharacterized protein LAESUDRAFT_749363 [Laetiporus sulphureus 93-53]|uniref:Uncharacterized protein n=1 Tax=Laetiporus sulphureus 93-53 TaxID=1314785 RepID=A0A165EUN3_9APHY|nr:uncharacterized protein LAESUDRAFT_749363 [Laetiporus sulphureus 93-53]KZT07797.1 hypothetical protein LAESUDRAFT_749363 [Laetiporus sulphureus 93-53]
MFGVTHTGSVIIFAILYGSSAASVRAPDVCYLLLSAAALASLAKSVDEVGVCLGAAYFMASFAFLTGTPINSALLGSDDWWYRPTVFSGIRGPSVSGILCAYRDQVVLVIGSVFTIIARFAYARPSRTRAAFCLIS